MSHQHGTLEDTIYFWFASNDTSGSGGDGATPLFDVREAGAAAGAIPLLSGTPTRLSHANFPAGCHEIAVAATAANGFAADDTFAVFCTLAIDSQNPTGFVGSCTLTPLAKDGTVLKPTVAGRTLVVDANGLADANMVKAGPTGSGTAQTANDNGLDINTLITQVGTAGGGLTNINLPDQTMNITGNLSGSVGSVTAAITLPTIPTNWIAAAGIAASALDGKGDWNVGKTGYSLTQAFPTNFADMSIAVTTGLVDITQGAADKSWSTAARALTDKAGFSLSTAGILAIWHQLTSAIVTAGSVGKLIKDYLDAAISSRNATTPPTAGAIRTELEGAGTHLALIKAKTDSFTFTVAGMVDSNVQAVNDVTVTGDGSLGNEWGP